MQKKLFLFAIAFLLTPALQGRMQKTITVHDKTFAVSIPREKIEARIKELGTQITRDYKDAEQPPIFIGVLRGAFMFLSDLVKEVDLACEIDFLQVSSYEGITQSTGIITLLKALKSDISGRDVIVVEDIVDTGLSITYVREMLQASNPKSIRIASLLDKKLSHLDFKIDYVGFEIAPEFVIGYGLDYNQQARNLPDIYTLIK